MADTQSFPLEMANEQTYLLPQFGAYDASKIYTQEVIRALVRHANIRGMGVPKLYYIATAYDINSTGVRIIPEFDQPGHVGNGWQFPGAENYTVCTNMEPWYDYCSQPPCGQVRSQYHKKPYILMCLTSYLFIKFGKTFSLLS